MPVDPFTEELRREVSAYFARSGKSPHANGAMVLKTVIMLAATVGLYALIVFGRPSPLSKLALCALMGVSTVGVGTVAHDALHGAFSSRPRVNRVMGYALDLVGISSAVWPMIHNQSHHGFTNVHDFDVDKNSDPFMRFSPGARHRPWYAYQHLYFLLPYSLTHLFIVFAKDFLTLSLLRREPTFWRSVRSVVIGKLLYVAAMVFVPIAVMKITVWQFALGYMTLSVTAGVIMAVIFLFPHVLRETPCIVAPDGRIDEHWMRHQLATNASFSGENRVLTWYLGGLNLHIEHHLFPRVCGVHYAALAPIVRRVAARHGVPYREHPTLRAALRSHLDALRAYGQRPEAHGDDATLQDRVVASRRRAGTAEIAA